MVKKRSACKYCKASIDPAFTVCDRCHDIEVVFAKIYAAPLENELQSLKSRLDGIESKVEGVMIGEVYALAIAEIFNAEDQMMRSFRKLISQIAKDQTGRETEFVMATKAE